MKTRRVGTLTLGICLILFGALFIAKLFIATLSYQFLLSLWPFILIILGVEVIAAYIINKDDKLKYDGAAFFLIIVMTMFAMVMAGFEFFLQHADELITVIR